MAKIVRKRNKSIVVKRKLSPLAIKFIGLVIANIDESDEPYKKYVFKVKDFQEFKGLDEKELYNIIDELIEELLSNPLKIPLNDEKNSILVVNWISSGEYNTKEIKIKISPKLKPFLVKAKKKFLKNKLEDVFLLVEKD